MASSTRLKPGAALLLHQLRRRAASAPRSWWLFAAGASAAARGVSSLTHGDGLIRDPPPGMAPLPEDASRQTPPRLGETDPAGPPVATTSEDKMGGGALKEGEAPEGVDVPDTTPPPDVPLPLASTGGSNV